MKLSIHIQSAMNENNDNQCFFLIHNNLFSFELEQRMTRSRAGIIFYNFVSILRQSTIGLLLVFHLNDRTRLHHASHSAHATTHRWHSWRVFFDFRNNTFSRGHQRRNARCIRQRLLYYLQKSAHCSKESESYLNWIDNTISDHINKFVSVSVVARRTSHDLFNDGSSFYSGVVSNSFTRLS